jgi:hypothetical protein
MVGKAGEACKVFRKTWENTWEYEWKMINHHWKSLDLG